MTIALERQFLLAENDLNFRERMTAACFNAARQQFLDDPSPDPTVQANREVLINNMLRNPANYARLFSWAVVSTDTIAEDNLADDAYLVGTVFGVFDKIATLIDPTQI